MGKVAPALVDRGRGGRSSQMAGNGTYATPRMEIDYVPIRPPVSRANWRRTNHMRTSRRADCLRTGSDRGWGRSETGMGRALSALHPKYVLFLGGMGHDGRAKRVARGLGEGGRTGARGPKCAYVRFPARIRPFPALRLAHGPFLASPPRSRAGRAVPRPDRPGSNPAWRQDPWFEPRLVAGPPARPCPNGRALARTPPIRFPIGGDRGHLATTPLDGLAEWQHPASPCETGCE